MRGRDEQISFAILGAAQGEKPSVPGVINLEKAVSREAAKNAKKINSLKKCLAHPRGESQ